MIEVIHAHPASLSHGRPAPAEAQPALHPDRMRLLARQFADEPAYRHVGLCLEDLARGRCQASARIVPALLHHRGAVQGGIVAMVADATAGYAALTLIDGGAGQEGDDMATLEFKTSFLLPAAGDTIRCVAQVVSHSKSIAFFDAQVYVVERGETRLCAQASLTFKRLRPRR
ncbi:MULTISPECIES: PaaI family thioesterase [Achromobacter]|uniref:PaaI family thioesterase n=2 Tax=Alcaligenes xylosoxydans xylosoxydans TaxID=85698 RepID=A0A0D6HVE8_ALCXX|nr:MULTISPECIES: PaaI family thioesterase [Achromobacter]EFV84661.1 hypothetical protein HMPREF0005_03946 [Achromobacter xylosoxidans C54]KWU21958.1 hypothetical protein AS148_04675 [Achromobacter xylosoxidans]MBK1980564.1 PaaI family thioesterase [Achromobacter xylosoxidans]MCH1987412.1 PaaI family thioesterase [Achromobacter xylosoxidans]MCH4575857.1 PaaI family thioesterase [Achromobacter xylosoxidans]